MSFILHISIYIDIYRYTYVDIFIYVKAKACFHTGGAKNLFSQSLGPIVGPVDNTANAFYSVCSMVFLIITNCNACTRFRLYFRAYISLSLSMTQNFFVSCKRKGHLQDRACY